MRKAFFGSKMPGIFIIIIINSSLYSFIIYYVVPAAVACVRRPAAA
jgi:hypothetical protein